MYLLKQERVHQKSTKVENCLIIYVLLSITIRFFVGKIAVTTDLPQTDSGQPLPSTSKVPSGLVMSPVPTDRHLVAPSAPEDMGIRLDFSVAVGTSTITA